MRSLLFLLALTLSISSFAQTSSFKGRILTTDGHPVASVNISIPALKLATSSDEDGAYLISNVKPGTYTVRFSHVGLEPMEQSLSFESGKATERTFKLKETAKQLDEIVVKTDKTTISRTPTMGKAGLSNLDNPQFVGVVSRTVISDQQALRLGDVVKNVAGVSMTQQRQGMSETFSARGYTIGVAGGTGSIFKNGVVTNTAGFPEASTLESVEVLKGSSALLYGNTSAGVVINMITKKPKFNWGGEVSMTAGSFSLYKPTLDLYGPISKDLAFRVVGSYENAGSYRDQVHTNRTYVNPSLLYKLGKNTTLLLQGDYLDADFTPDYGIGIINQNVDAIISPSRSRFINTSWAYYHSKTASGSLTLDHHFGGSWKLNVIAGGQDVKLNSFGTATPNSIDINGTWSRTLSRTRSDELNRTAQANLTGKFTTGGIGHQVLIGSDYVGVRTKTDAFRITSANGVIGVNYDKINIFNRGLFTERTDMPDTRDTGMVKAPSFRLGYYAQDLVSLSSKFKVLAGLRWSYLETQSPVTYNYTKGTETKGDNLISKAFSPKAALIYEPTQSLSVYASYANSFSTNTGTDIYNNPLKPSIIDDYEVGVKSYFFKGKVLSNLSIYRIRNSNLAQQALTLADGTPNTSTSIKELTGQTTSDGFDVDFSGTISKALYFMAGYGFTNARYTGSPGNKGTAVEGEQVNNSPKHTANGTIFYTFTESPLKGLKFGASAFYTGKRFGGNQNTVGQTPVYNRQVALSGFTTVDLSAGYSFHKISAQLKLANITNTLNYLVHDRYSVNPIPPRQLIATVSYKF